MAKIDKADIISIALAAPKIVAAFRALFGKNKTGAEKKKIATETLAVVLVVVVVILWMLRAFNLWG